MTHMLDLSTLRRKNVLRCTDPSGFNHPLAGWSVAEWGNATAGELGEACNIAKKLLRLRDNIPGNKQTPEELKGMFARELADTLIYLDLWAASQDIDLAKAVVETFNAKSTEIGSNVKL